MGWILSGKAMMGYCGQRISPHDVALPTHFTFHSQFPGTEAAARWSSLDTMDDGFITATDG